MGDKSKFKRLHVHLLYWIFILTLALIFVATDRWTSQKDFTAYLTNAATMISLVLGLVAIFYSFIANNGLSKSLGNISAVSSDVALVKEQISKSLDLAKSSADEGAQNIKLLEGTISSLENTISSLDEGSQKLQVLVGQIDPRFAQFEAQVSDRFKGIEKSLAERSRAIYAVGASADQVTPALVMRFLRRASLGQNLLTLACVLAKQTGKPLDLELFCKTIGSGSYTNYQGFLSCMDSVGLVDRELVEGRIRFYRVTDVDPSLLSDARAYIVDYLGRGFPDNPDARAKWDGALKAVDSLFSVEL